MRSISDTVWYVILGVIYIAILVALVRPGSPAAGAVTGVSSALTTLVKIATGNQS